MKVLLKQSKAHGLDWGLPEAVPGWLEGELLNTELGRCSVFDAEGNQLIAGGTPEFIQSLRDRDLLRDQPQEKDNEI